MLFACVAGVNTLEQVLYLMYMSSCKVITANEDCCLLGVGVRREFPIL